MVVAMKKKPSAGELEGVIARIRELGFVPHVSIPLVKEYADCFQIGARNVQNFNLLQPCGRAKKPVLLKRGLAATLALRLRGSSALR